MKTPGIAMIFDKATPPEDYRQQLLRLQESPARLIAEAEALAQAYRTACAEIDRLQQAARQDAYLIEQYQGDIKQIANAVYRILDTLGLIDPDSGQLVFRARAFTRAMTVIAAQATGGGRQFDYLTDLVPLLSRYAALIDQHPQNTEQANG